MQVPGVYLSKLHFMLKLDNGSERMKGARESVKNKRCEVCT